MVSSQERRALLARGETTCEPLVCIPPFDLNGICFSVRPGSRPGWLSTMLRGASGRLSPGGTVPPPSYPASPRPTPSRSARLRSAPPRRCAPPRSAAPVVCPGFGFDRFPDMPCMKRVYRDKKATFHWSAARKKERFSPC